MTEHADLLARVASEAASHAGLIAPGGEGLCLPVTAAVCRVLTDLGVPDVHAVCGGYNCEPHWWTRVGDLIVDPTRGQFDPGPLVSPASTEGYFTECEYPPGWTVEHVVLEAQRAFMFREAGALFAESLLGRLRLAAEASCITPGQPVPGA